MKAIGRCLQASYRRLLRQRDDRLHPTTSRTSTWCPAMIHFVYWKASSFSRPILRIQIDSALIHRLFRLRALQAARGIATIRRS
jgi:hypothetical protein